MNFLPFLIVFVFIDLELVESSPFKCYSGLLTAEKFDKDKIQKGTSGVSRYDDGAEEGSGNCDKSGKWCKCKKKICFRSTNELGQTTLRCGKKDDCDKIKDAGKSLRKRRSDVPDGCKDKCAKVGKETHCICLGEKCNFGSRPSPLLFASFAAVILPMMISKLVARI